VDRQAKSFVNPVAVAGEMCGDNSQVKDTDTNLKYITSQLRPHHNMASTLIGSHLPSLVAF
jgi:hypothetical protein